MLNMSKGHSVSTEDLEHHTVQDSTLPQDIQILQATTDRSLRSIFLESAGRHLRPNHFNDKTLKEYAEQIRNSYPESASKIREILEMDEPIEYTE